MMRSSVLTFAVGAFFAVLAVVLMNFYLGAQGNDVQEADEEPLLVPVVVSTTDLSFGTALRPDQLAVKNWPAEARPETAFATIEEVIGDGTGARLALREIGTGEPLLQSSITGFGERATLSRRVSVDKRAVSIRINDVSGVSGFTLPGDRVDVLLTRPLGANGDLVTDVILQNIVVLGIDQLTDQQRQQPVVARTATVEVDTEQAQKLALAQQLGTLSFALRNESAGEEVITRRVSAQSLGGEQRAVSAGPVVRVRRGTEDLVMRAVPVHR